MSESTEGTHAFKDKWGLISSDSPSWSDILHMDPWSKAQFVQRQGVLAEAPLVALFKQEESRRIWPVAITALTTPNEGSSDAMKAAIARYPWVGSGFNLELGMSAKGGPGEDKSALRVPTDSLLQNVHLPSSWTNLPQRDPQRNF